MVLVGENQFVIRHERPPLGLERLVVVTPFKNPDQGLLSFTRDSSGVHVENWRGISSRVDPKWRGAGQALQAVFFSAFGHSEVIDAEMTEHNLFRFLSLVYRNPTPSMTELAEAVPFFSMPGFDYKIRVSGDEVWVSAKKNAKGETTLSEPFQASPEFLKALKKRINEASRDHWGTLTPIRSVPTILIRPNCQFDKLTKQQKTD